MYELHGSTLRNYCVKCGAFYDVDFIATPDTDYYLVEIDQEPNDRYLKLGEDGSILP